MIVQSPLPLDQKLILSHLESHLWEAANILRGSPVDRTDWKSYILPLLFYKRICDVWDEEHSETVELYGEDFYTERNDTARATRLPHRPELLSSYGITVRIQHVSVNARIP